MIYGLEKSSLIDYPGKIACVVFLAGCNFRCRFCHNLELVLPELIKKQPKISEEDFFNFLETRRGLLDGVVVTGGEPTIYPDLSNFIKKIKNFGFLVKLDTNGTNPDILEKLINKKLIDYIAMDIKAPIGAKTQNSKLKAQNYNIKIKNKYEKIIGVKTDLEEIKKSIEIIKNSKVDHEFRTTVVPTLHTRQDIIDIAEYISPSKYFLQNFRILTGKVIDKSLKEDLNFLSEIEKNLPKETNIKTRN